MNKQAHMKAAVAAAFGAAAPSYDASASVQRRIAAALAGRIARLPLERPRILEIGCGTGFLSRALLNFNPREILLTDIAPSMVARCRAALPPGQGLRFAVMDGEAPGVAGGFDLICSSMTFQWFADLPGALERLGDLLAPGGHLAFATLAAGSFREWREAHTRLGLTAAMHSYPTPADLRAMLPGLAVEEDHSAQHSASGIAFLAQLKRIGAHLAREHHRPLGTGALRSVLRRFARGIDVTYHVAYGTWTRRP